MGSLPNLRMDYREPVKNVTGLDVGSNTIKPPNVGIILKTERRYVIIKLHTISPKKKIFERRVPIGIEKNGSQFSSKKGKLGIVSPKSTGSKIKVVT